MVKKKVATSNSVVTLVASDVGFGETKCVTSAKPDSIIVFPSVVVKAKLSSSKLFSMESIDPNNLSVTTEDGTFVVGKYAMNIPSQVSKRTKARDRASDEHSRVLFHTSIALAVPDTEGEHHVHIVTGLPNTDYDVAVQARLEEFLKKDFEVEFHLSPETSIKKKIIVDNVTVLRQPEGSITYHQFDFDRENFLVASPRAQEYVGVIDIGHFTTDYGLFQSGVLIEDERTNGSTLAVDDVYRQFQVQLVRFFSDMGIDYSPSDKDYDQVIRDKKIFFAGQDHDVAEIYNDSVKSTAKKIVKDVMENWGNEANRLRSMLLTGGGSYALADSIQEELKERNIQSFSVVPNAVVANALGYYMYGVMEIRAEGLFTDEELFAVYLISALEKELVNG